METELKNVQLTFDNDGQIKEDQDVLEVEKVEYEKLDKVDLVRLCKEKDTCIKSYEAERSSRTDAFNTELNNMNEYYLKRIKELKSLINYYERKFEVIKSLIDIEKDEIKEEK